MPGWSTHIGCASASCPALFSLRCEHDFFCLEKSNLVELSSKVFLFFPQEPYEILGDTACGDCHEGPRRGRLRVVASQSSAVLVPITASERQYRPFEGLLICPLGDLSPLSMKDFETMVTVGGGTMVEKPTLFPHNDLVTAARIASSASSDGEAAASMLQKTQMKCLIVASITAPGFNRRHCVGKFTKAAQMP